MIVGAYSLHLYCDSGNEGNHPHGYYDWESARRFPIEYNSDDVPNGYYTTRKMAKRDGWKLKRDGTAICPKCAKTTNR